MTSRIPQLIISLSPQGELICELPGHMGTRRQIEIRVSEAGETLKRILEGQARDGIEIGLDGAPTAGQVKHWERHGTWPDSRCRFCLAEGRAKPDYSSLRKKRTVVIEKRADGVEIRTKKIAEGTKGKIISQKNAGDMGL
jgi:hypothetical protein